MANDNPIMNGAEFAFTAVTTDTGATVGAAIQDISGYSNLSNMPEFKTYAEAMEYADTLNDKLGLTTLEAWRIVASTMRTNVPPPIAGDDPEWTPVLVVCDCEGPHFVGAQKSCRGLNGKNATGIYAN
jgi:hypothetical protein